MNLNLKIKGFYSYVGIFFSNIDNGNSDYNLGKFLIIPALGMIVYTTIFPKINTIQSSPEFGKMKMELETLKKKGLGIYQNLYSDLKVNFDILQQKYNDKILSVNNIKGSFEIFKSKLYKLDTSSRNLTGIY